MMAEAELETRSMAVASEEKFQSLYDGIMGSIPSSVLIFDNHLRVVEANQNFYSKARRTRRSTIGKTVTEVFPEVLINYTKLPEKIRSVFQSGEAFDGGETEYRAPGLPTRVYYYRLTPLTDRLGGTENVILLMDDVTERKRLGERIRRMEEHLARVVDSANDLIVSTDRSGEIVSWNNTIQDITGRRARDVTGKRFYEMFREEDQKSFRRVIRNLLRKKKVPDKEFSLEMANGESADVSWSFSSMADEEGKIIGLVFVGRDLTERKILEARLAQTAKMASLGTMAGGVAHEIRNPLAIIDATAQLLGKRSPPKAMANECVVKIRGASQRASEIVESMLSFARQTDFAFEDVDIHETLNKTVTLMENQLTLSHVEVSLGYADDIPSIRGNENRLQQVFVNLILNACQSMPDGGKLTITTKKLKDSIAIGFADTGDGIDEKLLPFVFDPFFTTRDVGKGTGLGLSVSYGIIEKHAGSIEVGSRKKKGTQFSIKLPIASKE